MEATFSLSKYHTMQPKIEQPVAALSEFPVEILERIFFFNPSFPISVVNKEWNTVWINSLNNPEFVMKLLPFCQPEIIKGYMNPLTFSENIIASKDQIFCARLNQSLYTNVPVRCFLKNLITDKEFMMEEPRSFFMDPRFLNGILHVLNEQGIHRYDPLSEKWILVYQCLQKQPIERRANENCLAFVSKNENGKTVKIYDARTGKTVGIEEDPQNERWMVTDLYFAGDRLIVHRSINGGQIICFDENGKFIKKIQKDNVLRVACNEEHVVVLFRDQNGKRITSYKSSDLSENYTFSVKLDGINSLYVHHDKIFIEYRKTDSGGRVAESELEMYNSKGLIDRIPNNVGLISFAGDWLALFRFDPLLFEEKLMYSDTLPLIEIYRDKEELVKVTEFNIKKIPYSLSFDTKPFQIVIALVEGNFQIWNPLLKYQKLEYQNRIKAEEPVSKANGKVKTSSSISKIFKPFLPKKPKQ